MDSGPSLHGDGTIDAKFRVVTSEQVGMLFHPLDWFTIRFSGGLTQRMPTFLELFGDRGTVVSNPEIESESGWNVDGGILMRARNLGILKQARLELTGFYRHAEDLIQLLPNSQVTF